MIILPLVLYFILLAIAFFAPLRWSIVAFIMISAVDFYSDNTGVGVLNAVKGIGYPIVLLWRLKKYAGHGKVIVAPVAWIVFVCYVAAASFWSIFPLSAVKLVIELSASFVIGLAFMRASKGGYLTPAKILIPATLGVLLIGVLRTTFLPWWGDSPSRFSGFTTAQAYASLLASLYALSLGTKNQHPLIRWGLCAMLFAATVADGSRIWVIGLLMSTVVGLLVSNTGTWLKIFGLAAIVLFVVAAIAAKEPIIRFIAQSARSNRVADTITAVYEGNSRSTGLGTYEFRRGLYQHTIDALEASTVVELAFGHGTSNGRILRGTLAKGVGDPNRAVHDEWLRILYEFGFLGLAIWVTFIGSIVMFAYQGIRKDPNGNSKPLLIYLPAFLGGLSTENIIAGAGHAENLGFILLIGIAAISHRARTRYVSLPEAFVGNAPQPLPRLRSALVSSAPLPPSSA
jgi:hypothetical protein